MILPFTPIAPLFGFQTPPLAMTGGILAVVTIYLVSAELLKQFAIRSVPARRTRHKSRSRAIS